VHIVGSATPLDGYPMHRFDKQFGVNLRAPFTLVSQVAG
jgi:3-oxoacyl-[acyl-carrier protein] reductase